jgi:hypothetical protein
MCHGLWTTMMLDNNYMLEKIINSETICACLNLSTGTQMLLKEGQDCKELQCLPSMHMAPIEFPEIYPCSSPASCQPISHSG